MKRIVLLFVILSFYAPLSAQELFDPELTFLVHSVCQLRNADDASYKAIEEKLEADELWTPMNETGPFLEQECAPSVRIPRFKLNRMLSQIGGKRKYVSTRGDMLNGEDERYDYSLYERSVQKDAKVSYSLTGREGRQVLVIVPYAKDGGGLSASVALDGAQEKPFVQTGRGDGSLYVTIDDDLQKHQVIRVTVTGGQSDQAFVLLNHNTRIK